MKTENAAEATPETVESPVTTTKAPPKSQTITLTAPGGTLQLIAERRADDSARPYAISTDTATKKSARGLTQLHPTFALAQKCIADLALKAAKAGWSRRVAGRKFVARPDAFTTIPSPKAMAPKSGKKGGA
jgi:hypothetical protein